MQKTGHILQKEKGKVFVILHHTNYDHIGGRMK